MTPGALRNQHPTPAAVFAMFHWHDRYAEQSGGSMDFFDSLTPRERQFCADAVARMVEAQGDEAAAPPPAPPWHPDSLRALLAIAEARPSTWEPDVRDQFEPWAKSIARAALENAAARAVASETDEDALDGSLVGLAINYAHLARFIAVYDRTDGERFFHGLPPSMENWPRHWPVERWKPNYADPVDNLTKAVSMLTEVIARLQAKRGGAR